MLLQTKALINNDLASGPSSLLCGQQTFLWGGTLTSLLSAEPHQKRVSAWAERQAQTCFHFSHFLFGFCFFLSRQVPFRCILNAKVFLFRIFHAGWAHTAGCIGVCLTVSGQLPIFSTKHQHVSSSPWYLMLHSAGKHGALYSSAL